MTTWFLSFLYFTASLLEDLACLKCRFRFLIIFVRSLVSQGRFFLLGILPLGMPEVSQSVFPDVSWITGFCFDWNMPFNGHQNSPSIVVRNVIILCQLESDEEPPHSMHNRFTGIPL